MITPLTIFVMFLVAVFAIISLVPKRGVYNRGILLLALILLSASIYFALLLV